MADLVQNAASVQPEASDVHPYVARQVVYGATVTRGQPVVQQSSNSRWVPADITGTAEQAGGVGFGIAQTPGESGDPGTVQVGGLINLGGTILTAGDTYIVSNTAGKVAPFDDYAGYAAPKRRSVIGRATSTSTLVLELTANEDVTAS